MEGRNKTKEESALWWTIVLACIKWLSLSRFVLVNFDDGGAEWGAVRQRFRRVGVHIFTVEGVTIFQLSRNPAADLLAIGKNAERQIQLWEYGRTEHPYDGEVWIEEVPHLTADEKRVLAQVRSDSKDTKIFCKLGKERTSEKQYVFRKVTDQERVNTLEPSEAEIPSTMRNMATHNISGLSRGDGTRPLHYIASTPSYRSGPLQPSNNSDCRTVNAGTEMTNIRPVNYTPVQASSPYYSAPLQYSTYAPIPLGNINKPTPQAHRNTTALSHSMEVKVSAPPSTQVTPVNTAPALLVKERPVNTVPSQHPITSAAVVPRANATSATQPLQSMTRGMAIKRRIVGTDPNDFLPNKKRKLNPDENTPPNSATQSSNARGGSVQRATKRTLDAQQIKVLVSRPPESRSKPQPQAKATALSSQQPKEGAQIREHVTSTPLTHYGDPNPVKYERNALDTKSQNTSAEVHLVVDNSVLQEYFNSDLFSQSLLNTTNPTHVEQSIEAVHEGHARVEEAGDMLFRTGSQLPDTEIPNNGVLRDSEYSELGANASEFDLRYELM